MPRSQPNRSSVPKFRHSSRRSEQAIFMNNRHTFCRFAPELGDRDYQGTPNGNRPNKARGKALGRLFTPARIVNRYLPLTLGSDCGCWENPGFTGGNPPGPMLTLFSSPLLDPVECPFLFSFRYLLVPKGQRNDISWKQQVPMPGDQPLTFGRVTVHLS